MSTLKVDLYPEEVYTFTPQGQGDRAAARRHADRFRLRDPLRRRQHVRRREGQRPHRAAASTACKNGDVVEILTQPGHLPSKDWLALVKTSRARNKIKHVINATERVKAIEIGQKYLEKEARRLGVQLGRSPRRSWSAWRREYGCSKIEDLHAALGYGKFSARQVLQKARARSGRRRTRQPRRSRLPKRRRRLRATPATPRRHGDLVIKVKGMRRPAGVSRQVLQSDSRRSIVGYVTRGKGVAVHSPTCPNVQNLMYEVERKIDVEWARGASEAFPVKHGDPHRRPAGHAESADVGAVRREEQHPQPGSEPTTSAAGWRDDRNDRRVRDKKQLESVVERHAPHLRRARRRATVK